MSKPILKRETIRKLVERQGDGPGFVCSTGLPTEQVFLALTADASAVSRVAIED